MKMFLTVLTFVFAAKSLSPSFSNSSSINLNVFTTGFNYPLDLSKKTISKVNSVNDDQFDSKQEIQDSNWYNTITQKIRNDEYKISYSNDYKSYQSPNRSNNLRFIYLKDGFSVFPRTNRIPLFDESNLHLKEEEKTFEVIPDWKLSIKLKSLGVSNNQKNDSANISFDNCMLKVNENKASIESPNLRIEYTNDENGMRQDFIIHNKPVSEGKLFLEFEVITELRMITGSDALMFKDENGVERIKYSSLKCWDAEGKELRAYFKESSGSVCTNSFSIIVNDENAVYPVTIDPLSTSAGWTVESNSANARLGFAVNTAGDVNNDGYSDVIVGAYTYDNGNFNEGAAYAYYGSASGLSTSPFFFTESNQDGAIYGAAVSTAGDVNNDGYSDVIIGAPYYDNPQTDEGKAFLYLGSGSGLTLSAWNGESNQAGAAYGISVCTAGDVNLDDKCDVIIGAYLYDSNFVDQGKAYVYYGITGAVGLSTLYWSYAGEQANENLGISVAFAGDVNASGGSDIVIGSWQYSNGQTNEGRIYIFYGFPGLTYFPTTPYPPSKFESNSPNSYFGISVSTAGDVNSDNYCDVIAGAHQYSNGQSLEGRAYLYLGNLSATPVLSSWAQEGNIANYFFGVSVSTAGDVNGDGYADVIVGASAFLPGDLGRAYVYYGNNTAQGLSTSPDWTGTDGQAGSQYGRGVGIAGDVNGDGYSDIIVGAPTYTNGQSLEGKVYCYHGSPAGLSSASKWTVTGVPTNQTNTDFGFSVCTAGDINADGYSEVIIGAPYYDNGSALKQGRVFIYYGSASGLAGYLTVIPPSGQNFYSFGHSVATAGDVNDDGYGDIIVGAPYNSNGEAFEGKAYVFYGYSLGISAVSYWSVEFNQANANFGNSVSSAGDVNGDGFADILVGAYHHTNGQTEEGRAYLFNGSAAGPSSTPSWTTETDEAFSHMGFSVAAAGDVNGDGYNDVLVGAPDKDNSTFTDGGAAYFYYGSSSGLSAAPDWSIPIFSTGTHCGYSVSTAGDLDGNGCSDFIIGIPQYSYAFSNDGLVLVYYGYAGGIGSTPTLLPGGSADTRFGCSISTAGDVNGDGYNDIIAGAFLDNGFGKATVYHGSKLGITGTSGWTAAGSQSGEYFGYSVSTAGDVNGDGYSDVIVGSYKYNNSGQVGRVYSYYGNDGISKTSRIRQYKPFTTNSIYSGGYSGTYQNVRFSLLGRSPYGKTKGKIVYEHKLSGLPYSTGSNLAITNSVSSSGSGAFAYMNSGSGYVLNQDVGGLSYFLQKETKWRARIQYQPNLNPYQKFGPWKYYSSYIPLPNWNFRPTYHSGFGMVINLKMFIQGFYNSESNTMISDTVRVYLQSSDPPYALLDSGATVINEDGEGTIGFYRKDPCCRTIKTKGRNLIETWSTFTITEDSNEVYIDFTSNQSQAYGDNLIQIDSDPVRYAVYNGDVNQDGFIDGSDGLLIDNDAANFLTGYLPTDVTGDGFIDGSDMQIEDNNAANFVGVIRP